MSGIPMHPSMAAVQTPPQAGVERHTTPENIRRFFDPNTYRVLSPPSKGIGCAEPTSCQKRPPPSDASSSAPPAAKPKMMQREELMEKFKLAAKLNGIEWDDLAVTGLTFGSSCFKPFKVTINRIVKNMIFLQYGVHHVLLKIHGFGMPIIRRLT